MIKPIENTEKWKKIAITSWAIIGIVIILWILALLLQQIKIILPIIVYTMVLVYILRPAVEILHKKGIPRIFSVLITYLIVAALIGLLFWYLVPIASKQMVAFAHDLPNNYYPKIQKFGQDSLEMYQERLGGTVFDIDKFVNSYSARAKEFGIGFISVLPAATMDLFGGLFNLIIAPILAFYILKDLPIIKKTISDLIPAKNRDEVLTLIHKANVVLAGFLKGQLMVSLIVGLLVGIWLTIIGVDFPFVLGMIAGLLNVIPYLGPILGGSIAALVAAFEAAPIIKVSLVVAGMLSIQQLDSAIISPQVMRRQVNLHPVMIVFALLIGGSLFGIMGMVLAIPSLAVAKVMLYHFVEKSDIF